MLQYLSLIIFSVSLAVSAEEPITQPLGESSGENSMVRFLTCKPKSNDHRFVELNVFALYTAFLPPGDILNNTNTPAFVQVITDADSEYAIHLGIPAKIKKYPKPNQEPNQENETIQVEFIDRILLGSDELRGLFSKNESGSYTFTGGLVFYDKSVTLLDCRLLPLPH